MKKPYFIINSMLVVGCMQAAEMHNTANAGYAIPKIFIKSLVNNTGKKITLNIDHGKQTVAFSDEKNRNQLSEPLEVPLENTGGFNSPLLEFMADTMYCAVMRFDRITQIMHKKNGTTSLSYILHIRERRSDWGWSETMWNNPVANIQVQDTYYLNIALDNCANGRATIHVDVLLDGILQGYTNRGIILPK